MDNETTWKEIVNTSKIYTIWTITSLIDSLFVILWVLIQYYSNKAINSFELSGIDRIVLYVFQLIFGLSTLAPVIIKIYVDIFTMVLKGNRIIKQEIQKGIKP